MLFTAPLLGGVYSMLGWPQRVTLDACVRSSKQYALSGSTTHHTASVLAASEAVSLAL